MYLKVIKDTIVIVKIQLPFFFQYETKVKKTLFANCNSKKGLLSNRFPDQPNRGKGERPGVPRVLRDLHLPHLHVPQPAHHLLGLPHPGYRCYCIIAIMDTYVMVGFGAYYYKAAEVELLLSKP